MRTMIAAVILMALAACTPEARDSVARDAARGVIRPVVAQQFPGVPLEPAVDCIIDNASAREILTLAADAMTGPTASTAEMVAQISSRPETLRCLAVNGLPALLR